MKKLALLVSASLTLVISNPSFAGNPEAGKSLHDEANCLRCHTAQPYNPAKTNTYEKLVAAVSFCNNNLNAGWFDDEVADVAAYLNQKYYKLPN
ncbi:MAG: cytochrome c [Thiomicrospira sp.]|uniref:c-type cytochrome n=1 Tax=Thiomicrospira sp. TaxID=935 RepID=UPI001A0DFC25|nr:cytochrome c [Thiomicrospira sp.]MBE0493222.1 cytochrome c [Thiomicrospira sp.]